MRSVVTIASRVQMQWLLLPPVTCPLIPLQFAPVAAPLEHGAYRYVTMVLFNPFDCLPQV